MKIFLNMVVNDLEKSKAFFTALGFSIDPQFTDATAASIVFSDQIYAMIMTPETMKRFTKKEIADPRKVTETIVALSVDSRAQVDQMASKAIAAGARESRPAEDYGWMYGKAIEDLDGHIWEFFWIDLASAPKNPGA